MIYVFVGGGVIAGLGWYGRLLLFKSCKSNLGSPGEKAHTISLATPSCLSSHFHFSTNLHVVDTHLH